MSSLCPAAYRWLSAGFLVLLMTGCSDDIVGDWEARQEGSCGTDRFVVDSDLSVSGHFYDPSNNCEKCRYAGDFEEKGDSSFDSDIRFGTCECDGSNKAQFECELNDEGNRADCTLDWGSCAEGESQDYDKDES